jgi:hypothetical protein
MKFLKAKHISLHIIPSSERPPELPKFAKDASTSIKLAATPQLVQLTSAAVENQRKVNTSSFYFHWPMSELARLYRDAALPPQKTVLLPNCSGMQRK